MTDMKKKNTQMNDQETKGHSTWVGRGRLFEEVTFK